MKKRYFGVVLAAMMMTQPLLAQGAVNPSPNTNPVVRPSGGGSSREPGRGSSRPLDANATGPAMTGGSTGAAAVGVTVTADNTLAGNAVNVPEDGTMAVGHINVRFASDAEVKEDFPWSLAETIFTINSGTTPLYQAIGTPDTVGYNPLIPVETLVVEDTTVNAKTANATSVTLYVPNLMEGLNNVQILYYNAETKKWELLAPAAVDYATKQISVTLKGGTPFTVVYKNQ